jgi:hypothetical protein
MDVFLQLQLAHNLACFVTALLLHAAAIQVCIQLNHKREVQPFGRFSQSL